MSDPFCLALTVVPILATWEATTSKDEDDDDDEQHQDKKSAFQQQHHDPQRAGDRFLPRLLSCAVVGDVYEDWWNCMTLPCRPCSADAFFQLDEHDDGVVVTDHDVDRDCDDDDDDRR